MEKRKWIDMHVHVSDHRPDGAERDDITDALLEVLDRSGADLRFTRWLRGLSHSYSFILLAYPMSLMTSSMLMFRFFHMSVFVSSLMLRG